MPFTSAAPRRSLGAKHPQSAERWAHAYPHPGHLPRQLRRKNKRHKRASVPAVFSRLGLAAEPDETRAGPAAVLYAVNGELWPSQVPFSTAASSLNPGPASSNSRAGVQPQEAQPLIPADQPVAQSQP
jgi:hypothetical protein